MKSTRNMQTLPMALMIHHFRTDSNKKKMDKQLLLHEIVLGLGNIKFCARVLFCGLGLWALRVRMGLRCGLPHLVDILRAPVQSQIHQTNHVKIQICHSLKILNSPISPLTFLTSHSSFPIFTTYSELNQFSTIPKLDSDTFSLYFDYYTSDLQDTTENNN